MDRRLLTALKIHLIQEVPSFANRIFYSLGFLSMVSFVMLFLSGMVMVFFGPYWWLTTQLGLFTRSVHLWATQAFIFFILLHALIVFATSGFKPPRRLTWIFGSLMLFLAMFEAEFGYGLRGDYSAQWRSLQAADFYNGAALGTLINNLNYAQIYGIHIIIIPLVILALLTAHYFLVRILGIARLPHLEKSYPVVHANHTVLFLRGFILAGVIVVLAEIFPSPLIIPTTIKSVAASAPALVAKTLTAEMDRSSDTATYSDNIDPYTFDTRSVFIAVPYTQYIELTGQPDRLTDFAVETENLQKQQLDEAAAFFENGGSPETPPNRTNPVYSIVSSLVAMAKTGLYEQALTGEATTGMDATYVRRFLSDTGVLEAKAEELAITTDQYGMVREEKGSLPGAWWLVPVGVFNHTILANDPNGDRDGAILLGVMMLFLLAVPYIPGLNSLPEKLHLERLIYGRPIATQPDGQEPATPVPGQIKPSQPKPVKPVPDQMKPA